MKLAALIGSVSLACAAAGACAVSFPDVEPLASGGAAGTGGAGPSGSQSSPSSSGTANGGGSATSMSTSNGGGGAGGQNGGACTKDSMCTSGHCVDGVCCESSCDGQCQACDVTPGSCVQVPSGQPHGTRTACAGAGTTCGGKCGSETDACDYPDPTAVCAPESCMNSVHTPQATCDGAGKCSTPTTQSCGALICNGNVCFTSCTTDGQCVPPASCNGGNCLGTKPLGDACTGNGDCTSGFCADGVCCNTGCTGQCEACNITPGTCSQVAGAPVGSRTACNGMGSCAGVCGSSRVACDYPTNQCIPQSCDTNTETETFVSDCDGAGNCPAAGTRACAPYVCAGTSCLASCTSDGDCTAGNHCNAGNCTNQLPNGDACTSANQCFSGICADGFCCNSACTGQCQACDVSPGTCTAVTGAPHGTKTPCTADPNTTQCTGSCNGLNTTACIYPTNACYFCQSAGFPLTTQTAHQGGTCGNGTCNGTTSTGCGNYACYIGSLCLFCATSAECYTSCTTNSQCRVFETCTGGVCG